MPRKTEIPQTGSQGTVIYITWIHFDYILSNISPLCKEKNNMKKCTSRIGQLCEHACGILDLHASKSISCNPTAFSQELNC